MSCTVWWRSRWPTPLWKMYHGCNLDCWEVWPQTLPMTGSRWAFQTYHRCLTDWSWGWWWGRLWDVDGNQQLQKSGMLAVQLSLYTSLLPLTHAPPFLKKHLPNFIVPIFSFLSGFFTKVLLIFRILVVQVRSSIPFASSFFLFGLWNIWHPDLSRDPNVSCR